MPAKTLQKNTLEQALKTHYNLQNPDHFASVLIGVSNIYLVKSEGKTYFIKETQDIYDNSQINDVSKITNYLATKGINTPAVIKNTQGTYATRIFDSTIQVQEYIEGSTFINHQVSDEVMFWATQHLALINTYLKDYDDVKFTVRNDYIKNLDTCHYHEKFDTLIKDANKNLSSNDKYKEKIIDDLKFKKDSIKHFENLNIKKDKVTFVKTHGDFHPKQLVKTKEKIYIVDFDNFCMMPAVIELLHFYFQASNVCKSGKIDKEELKKYLLVYSKTLRLTKYDLLVAPTLYARRYIRGSFGYKQYIRGLGTNREAHLQFGFWLTSIQKTLVAKMKSLGEYLSS